MEWKYMVILTTQEDQKEATQTLIVIIGSTRLGNREDETVVELKDL